MHNKISVLFLAAMMFACISNAAVAGKKKPDVRPEDARRALADLYTPGMFIGAAQRGETDFVRLFLDGEMDVNVRLKDSGDTALMRAAGEGHLDTVKVLVDYGADVNLKNNNGDTALSLARKKKFEATAKFLADAGATP